MVQERHRQVKKASSKRKREEVEAAREIENSGVGVISVMKDSHEFKKFKKAYDHFTKKETEAIDSENTEADDDDGHLFDLYKVCERMKSGDPRKSSLREWIHESFSRMNPSWLPAKQRT